mmetsp:Transcript_12332/g.53057  ORF Transcript_12332/g.53057 Transcript_12332/m.53057 type:complete len:213 (-) Transcript_12332:534-1172(-)
MNASSDRKTLQSMVLPGGPSPTRASPRFMFRASRALTSEPSTSRICEEADAKATSAPVAPLDRPRSPPTRPPAAAVASSMACAPFAASLWHCATPAAFSGWSNFIIFIRFVFRVASFHALSPCRTRNNRFLRVGNGPRSTPDASATPARACGTLRRVMTPATPSPFAPRPRSRRLCSVSCVDPSSEMALRAHCARATHRSHACDRSVTSRPA